MGEIINMALISFITGFGIVTIYERNHKFYRIQNRIIGGCIVVIVCTLVYVLLVIF